MCSLWLALCPRAGTLMGSGPSTWGLCSCCSGLVTVLSVTALNLDWLGPAHAKLQSLLGPLCSHQSISFFPYYSYEKLAWSTWFWGWMSFFLSDWADRCIGGYKFMERYCLVVHKLVRSRGVLQWFISPLWKNNSLWPPALLLVVFFSRNFKLVKFSQSQS